MSGPHPSCEGAAHLLPINSPVSHWLGGFFSPPTLWPPLRSCNIFFCMPMSSFLLPFLLHSSSSLSPHLFRYELLHKYYAESGQFCPELALGPVCCGRVLWDSLLILKTPTPLPRAATRQLRVQVLLSGVGRTGYREDLDTCVAQAQALSSPLGIS